MTDALSVGVGGRYWSMRTTSGNVNFGGVEIVPMRYAAEQAHMLVQGSYKFNESRIARQFLRVCPDPDRAVRLMD